ncbi:hypothetical protein ADUPG1_007253, partial [Aduncisulcus paluster]
MIENKSPFLFLYGSKEFGKFYKDFDQYRARGGKSSLFSLIDMDILPIYADVVGTVLKHPDLLSSPDEVRENEETFLNKVIEYFGQL